MIPSLSRYLPLRPPQQVNKLLIDQLEEESEALSFHGGSTRTAARQSSGIKAIRKVLRATVNTLPHKTRRGFYISSPPCGSDAGQ